MYQKCGQRFLVQKDGYEGHGGNETALVRMLKFAAGATGAFVFSLKKAKLIDKTREIIRRDVIGINDAQTFSILAGSKPGEVVITGEGAAAASEFLKRGYGKWFKVARVMDGDTLVFEDGSRARLSGVNAPEIAHPEHGKFFGEKGGLEAAEFLSDMAPVGSDVYYAADRYGMKDDAPNTKLRKGAFGRNLGYLFNKKGVDVNKEIIKHGYAKPKLDYSHERYEEFGKVGSIKKQLPKGKNSLLKSFEGFRTKAYPDGKGRYSIGYGTIARKGDTISKKEAEKRMNTHLSGVRRAIKQKVDVRLNSNEQEALESFIYNLGPGVLTKEVVSAIKNRKKDPKELIRIWKKHNHAGGKVNKALTVRRRKELKRFFGIA